MELKAQIFRDGTSQRDRLLPALNPDYVAVDERNIEDWLQFSQVYSSYLKYFNLLNQADGDWAPFFAGDIQQMLDYIKNPEDFDQDEGVKQKLAQPHLALLFTFLKLLHYPQQQFKDLTQRYLDFHYRKVLGLWEKSAIPDRVHIIFQLAKRETEHLVKKGTLLTAGPDSQGIDRYYQVDEDIVVNCAQISSIKTFYLEKVYIDLAIIHGDRSGDGFKRMLRWAIGSPHQGDPFPNYPDGTLESLSYQLSDLENLYSEIKDENIYQISDTNQTYILEQLCFTTIDEFKTCFDVHDREIQKQQGNLEIVAPTDSEWEQVYGSIEQAYKKKINRARRKNLQVEHEANGFLSMMEFALGVPNSGDPLPTMPENYTTLEQILAGIQGDDLDAKRYVMEQLYLSIDDFQKIMETQQSSTNNSQSSTALDAEAMAQAWSEVYRLVEKAQTKKDNFIYPPIGYTEIQNLHATSIADAQPDALITLQRFPTFHTLSDSGEFLGFAITSPILNLQEGQREIILTLGCRADSFNRSILIDEILNKEIIPFRLLISSEKDWLTIDINSLNFKVGDFILEAPLKHYQKQNVDPIYATANDEEQFDIRADLNQYLQLKDGTVFQIVEVLSASKIRLHYIGWLPDNNEYIQYENLTLTDEPVAINVELLLSSEQTEITTQAQQNFFTQTDEGQFIVWGSGDIYKINQFITARRIAVIQYGYLPRDGNILPVGSTPLKYQTLNFVSRPVVLSALEMTGVFLSTGDQFSRDDISQVMVWDTGKAVKIMTVSAQEATVQEIGILSLEKDKVGTIRQYRSSDVYLNSLQFSFTLDANQPAITAMAFDVLSGSIESSYPIIKGMLKTIEEAGQPKSLYQKLKSLCLEKVHLKVNVQDVQDIQLRNDRTVLSSSSPFQPFDIKPKTGSGFYFSNLEISCKPLTYLSLHLEWMGLPESFVPHYAAYSRCDLSPALPSIDNHSFKAQLKLLHNRTWQDIQSPQELFAVDSNDTLLGQANLTYDLTGFNSIPNYTLNTHLDLSGSDDPFTQIRYFKLELSSPDFLHKYYALVLNKVALASDETIKSLTVYEPYQPELKSISLDYSASIEIDLTRPQDTTLSGQISGQIPGQVFQLHPFGYVNILDSDTEQNLNTANDTRYYFLPQYEQEGAVFIGIRDLKPPQSLSILFQIISGSANVDIPQPEINWSYLRHDRWQAFQTTEVLSDGTNGLVDSGIIRFSFPVEATNKNHLLPQGLYWLRATVHNHTEAIPDTLDIRTQAVIATFIDRDNAPDHLNKPLAADSIQSFVKREAAIANIAQPYSSFQGRMQENSTQFYQRVSERLRHKQRAVTTWDYERLVLEEFPQIYKVKALAQANQNNMPEAAQVTVVIVPDISNTAPFFPLEPKAPLYLLKQIAEYVKSHASPFVNVIVKNPRYEQIKYRIAVRLRSGYEQGYYLNQLNQDLIQFLSPWAYDAQADITFGSTIHSSAVIHFVETRSYVDYVANLKLIEQVTIASDKADKLTTIFQVNTNNLAQVHYPDSILVSAPEHIIDVITTEAYSADEFEGIDYMIVGLDFAIT